MFILNVDSAIFCKASLVIYIELIESSLVQRLWHSNEAKDERIFPAAKFVRDKLNGEANSIEEGIH